MSELAEQRPPIAALESRVTILRPFADRKRVRFTEPLIVDGRQFTEELVPSWEPYHRKLAASIADVGAGKLVTIRELRDVSTAMRLQIGRGPEQFTIIGVGRREQTAEGPDGKKINVVFTELHCMPAA